MMKTLRTILKVAGLILVAIITLLAFNACKGKHQDDYFVKKITRIDMVYFKKEQAFTHAFDSKLPLVVKNDMRRASKKDEKLLYKYGKTYMVMEKAGDTWTLKVTDSSFNKLEDEELCNFSIFKNEDSGFSIYGNSTESGFYIKMKIDKKGNTSSEVFTYDNAVPFAYKQLGMPSEIGDYYYVATHEKIFLFKKGELKAYQNFPGEGIYNSYIINGGYIIADEDGNKNVYKVEVYANKSHPYVSYSFIATIDSYDDYRITGIEGSDATLLVIKQEGKEYVAVPENWDDYWEMDMIGDTSNGVKFDLVPVDDLRLKPMDDID